jgi:hypothetical protein
MKFVSERSNTEQSPCGVFGADFCVKSLKLRILTSKNDLL